MFNDFPKSKIDIVSPSGEVRATTSALVQANLVVIADSKVNIQIGDEIRRVIPNGTEEVFEVLDPVFYEDFHGIDAHFQVKIRKKGAYPKGTGGNYSIHINGNNSHVNVASTDNSINHLSDKDIFCQLAGVVNAKISSNEEKSLLLSAIEEMNAAKNDKADFLNGYQKFIASAANHMTIIAPFLPALMPFMHAS